MHANDKIQWRHKLEETLPPKKISSKEDKQIDYPDNNKQIDLYFDTIKIE